MESRLVGKNMWLTTIVLAFVALALGIASALVYGASRWKGKIKDLTKTTLANLYGRSSVAAPLEAYNRSF
jgi:hypothetical protein